MSNIAVRSAEIAALADALARVGSVRVERARLWELWAAAAPRLVGAPTQVAGLVTALQHLAHQGVVELPKRAWDTSTAPPLPRFVAVPAARTLPRSRPWITYPWRRELGWVSSLPTLSEARFGDLVAVSEWLNRTSGTNVQALPLRYRSVDIFGDEKRIEEIARSDLFGPTRLSFELLACIRIPAPLPAVAVGPGSDLFVVENSDTYWVAIDMLRNCASHSIGAVAWGSGNSFPGQVTALAIDVAGRGPVTGNVWYWGDLDPTGVEIGTNAAAAAAIERLPVIRPAEGLWAAMVDRPIQDGGKHDWSSTIGQDWLGARLWKTLAPVRAARGRVAQEALPPAAVRTWATSIR